MSLVPAETTPDDAFTGDLAMAFDGDYAGEFGEILQCGAGALRPRRFLVGAGDQNILAGSRRSMLLAISEICLGVCLPKMTSAKP